MEENGLETFLKGVLLIGGIVLFIGGCIWFAVKQDTKNLKLIGKKYPLFLVRFRHDVRLSRELTEPLYEMSDGKGFSILFVVLNIIVLLAIFLFVKGAIIFKIVMVLISVALFYVARGRANRYFRLYENAIVIGNRRKEKVFWFDEIDSIEAKFAALDNDTIKRPHIAQRAYVINKNGKQVSGFVENVFPGAAEAIEAYFSADRPFVQEVRQSIFRTTPPPIKQ